MNILIKYDGQTFNRLTIVKDSGKRDKQGARIAIARCSCGNTIERVFHRILDGRVKSCGCLSVETKYKHGLRNHQLYTLWAGMIQRCQNKEGRSYKNYGGRGVFVCDEWRNNFKSFYDWALNNGWNNGLDLDKDIKCPIGETPIYCPEHCSFVTRKQNSRKRRSNIIINYNGQSLCLTEWAEKLNIRFGTLQTRLFRGWTIDRAFNLKVA